MEFTFSNDQRALRDAVRDFIHAETPISVVREHLEVPDAVGSHIWGEVTRLGWHGLLVPTHAGGLGGGPIEAVAIAETLGAILHGGPMLAAGMLAPWALATLDAQSQLANVVNDARRFALAIEESGAGDPIDRIATTASGRGNDYRLHGVKVAVIDTTTDMPVWAHYFDLGVRPIAFDTNADGSTRRAYAQLTDFNGFAVLDFDSQKEVARIKYPDVDKKTEGHGGNTAHGIAVTPDNKTLVANSSINSVVYVYSIPDLKLLGQANVGHSPNWITLTPDGKFAYISLAGANSVAVLDIKAVKVVTEIKTGGQVPKRNATIVMAPDGTQ